MNALELIEAPPVSTESIVAGIAAIQANFGVRVEREKAALLYNLIRQEGWTEERWKLALKWFLSHQKYPAWTIADWSAYGVKLRGYAWYVRQCIDGNASGVQGWHIGDQIGYTEIGEEIPFPKHAIGGCEYCQNKEKQ